MVLIFLFTFAFNDDFLSLGEFQTGLQSFILFAITHIGGPIQKFSSFSYIFLGNCLEQDNLYYSSVIGRQCLTVVFIRNKLIFSHFLSTLCGGLNDNALRGLSVWILGSQFLGRLRLVTLLEEVCQWGWVLMLQKTLASPKCASLFA